MRWIFVNFFIWVRRSTYMCNTERMMMIMVYNQKGRNISPTASTFIFRAWVFCLFFLLLRESDSFLRLEYWVFPFIYERITIFCCIYETDKKINALLIPKTVVRPSCILCKKNARDGETKKKSYSLEKERLNKAH